MPLEKCPSPGSFVFFLPRGIRADAAGDQEIDVIGWPVRGALSL